MTSTVPINHICEPETQADTTKRVAVRLSSPFDARDLNEAWPVLEQLLTGQADDFAPREAASFLALSQTFGQQGGRTWTIRFNDIAVGWIAVAPLNSVSAGLYLLLVPDMANSDANREAIALALTETLSEFPAIVRISTTMFAEDELTFPLVISLCELGAQHEARLRRQTLRNGAPVDVSILGILRDDFFAATRKPRAD